MGKNPLTKQQLQALDKRLGKEYDVVLAKEYGVSRQFVSARRIKRGKEAFNAPAPLPYPIPVPFSKQDIRNIKRAMKKIGQKYRSRFIRKAVRKYIEEVLNG
jgi:hypothetical protein